MGPSFAALVNYQLVVLVVKNSPAEGDQPWDFFGRNHVKLKLEYFGHLMQRVDSLENTLMLEGLGAGGEGDDRG